MAKIWCQPVRLTCSCLSVCTRARPGPYVFAADAGRCPVRPRRTNRCARSTAAVADAPAAFDNQSNGFTPPAQFTQDKDNFESVEKIDDGLGPVFNATSCVSCHQNPVTGSSSQIPEIRAGPLRLRSDHPGRAAFISHPRWVAGPPGGQPTPRFSSMSYPRTLTAPCGCPLTRWATASSSVSPTSARGRCGACSIGSTTN